MQTLRSGASHALLVVDIDCFKSANDTLGHAWCDNVIVRIVEVLKASFRSEDIMAEWAVMNLWCCCKMWLLHNISLNHANAIIRHCTTRATGSTPNTTFSPAWA